MPHTIMGKTADITFFLQKVFDTLHKEGKKQKVTAKECSF